MNDLNPIVYSKMPILFVGHGSPMNAIEENEFVSGFRKIADSIPKPRAILSISAHWETKGTFFTAMKNPRTIHDFSGFPNELYSISYPAPGNPELAEISKQLITKTNTNFDMQWGLDHGTWTILKHMYPNADIPVVQMSLDYTKNPQYHYELAKELLSLRSQGVLILGSGNIVHNLRMIAWDSFTVDNYAYDWTTEVSEAVKYDILHGNHSALYKYEQRGTAFKLAVPTPEHFLPLLYILALQQPNDTIHFFNDKSVAGSLTMTSVLIT